MDTDPTQQLDLSREVIAEYTTEYATSSNCKNSVSIKIWKQLDEDNPKPYTYTISHIPLPPPPPHGCEPSFASEEEARKAAFDIVSKIANTKTEWKLG